MGGRIGRGGVEGEIKPPRIAGTIINIPPLGVLLWDNQEVPPGETTTIDIFGYTYVTLFVEVDKPANIILAAVSQDGTNWRHVEERIIAFTTAGKKILSLNEEIKTKGIFLYRYLKLRMDSEDSVKITLEATSKLMDADILYATAENLPGKIEKIYELLKIRFSNPDTWDHYHKDVNTPGEPVQLSDIVVLGGYALVVKAKDTNTRNIYIGSTYNGAKDSTRHVTLTPNSSTTLYIKNAEEVWIDADIAKEGVVYWTEKRKWL